MAIEYQIQKSSNPSQPYFWRVVSTGNHEVLCHSENYTTKAAAIATAYLVQGGSAAAQVLDYTGE